MSTPEPQARVTRTGPATRERILDAATQLFYANGLRSVSADRIVAQVGITKVTFYRHFPTKEDLIVAYLERRARWERDAVEAARAAAPGKPAEALRMIVDGIGQESCSPGFRGCPFINAAAEYPDPEHPVRVVVGVHRAWFKGAIEEFLIELGVSDSSRIADQLVMLRDGAMVSGYLGDPATVADALYYAGLAVIEQRSRTEDSRYVWESTFVDPGVSRPRPR
ncbi:TetR/AcrR family transcriptional regulator [Lysinimonas soli]|uniref:TetR/AcrR family transcriptional regulator n=1 Tax=Lysinimonas soli TaxID=1074233 RepID=A0ABW0NND3_9MICO